MSNPKERMNNSYIENKLGSIFEPMVAAYMKEQQGDHVSSIFSKSLNRSVS